MAWGGFMAKSKKNEAPKKAGPVAAKAPRPFYLKIKPDLRGFFKELFKVGVHTLAGNIAGVAISGRDALAATVGFKTKTEELAWTLVRNAMLQAVVVLVHEARDELPLLEDDDDIDEGSALADGNAQAVAKALELDKTKQRAAIAERVGQALADTELTLDRRLFERPAELDFAAAMRSALTTWLIEAGLPESRANSVGARLPSYFVFELNAEWNKNRTLYEPIRQLRETPFRDAQERESRWNLYAAWLDREADRPIFGETFGLRQIHIPLRAVRHTHDADLEPTGEDLPLRDPRKPPPHEKPKSRPQAVWLNESVEQWLKAWDGGDAIRVLNGGPGSGKSSFSRLFAADIARLAEQMPEPRPRAVLIPLHLLPPREDLTEAVHQFCEQDPHLPDRILDAKTGESRLLLIFDGLDELDKQGKSASQAANDFMQNVLLLVNRLNRDGAPPRALILLCGRPVAVQAGESLLRRDGQILELLPYKLTDRQREAYADPQRILDQDQRDEWWRKLGECIRGAAVNPYNRLPQVLRGEEFREITAQPLLNYLIALSIRRGKLRFEGDDAPNLNQVYYDLLEAVHERAYAQRHRGAQGLSIEEFARALEEIALAAWHGGEGRAVAADAIAARCGKTPKVRLLLERIAKDAESGVIRLLTAFYFRRHGEIDGKDTYEFTHKSFGEYLTARRIVRGLDLIHEERQRLKDGKEGGWDEVKALEHWLDLCGPAELTHELDYFL